MVKMSRVSPWSMLRCFWNAGKLDMVAFAAQVGITNDFYVPWFPKNIFVVQTHDAAKAVMSASSELTSTYTAFAEAAELHHDFTALAEANDSKLHLVHDGFKSATLGHNQRIPELVRKHIDKFFQATDERLETAFEKFYDAFWCDYLFGRDEKPFLLRYSVLKKRLVAVMRYRFYSNQWTGTCVGGLAAWLFHRSRQSTNELAECKKLLSEMIATTSCMGATSWVGRLRIALETKQQVAEPLTVLEDIVFEMFFIPEFLQGVVLQQLRQTQEERVQFPREAFLFPFRGRVLREAVRISEDTEIPAGSLVFVNLLEAKLYHSYGKRPCLGQAFTKVFKDACWKMLDAVDIKEEAGTWTWTLRRDYLKQHLSAHDYKGRPFYDVLQLNEMVWLRTLVVLQLQQALEPIVRRDQQMQWQVVLVAPEVRGLPIASILADRMRLPLVTVRKRGGYKMDDTDVFRTTYKKGYNETDTLELPRSKSEILNQAKVIIFDDGIASGNSALACGTLVMDAGAASVSKIACVINHTYASKAFELTEIHHDRWFAVFDF